MIGEKELHFQGKATDLAQLQSKVEGYLEGRGSRCRRRPRASRGR